MKMFSMQVVKLKERKILKIKVVEVSDFSVKSLVVKIGKTRAMKELNRSGVK